MKFVFWQHILSIHQSSFLNALAREHDVVLVVEEETDKHRIVSGWNKPMINCQKIIVSPSETIINNLLEEYHDRIHIISGLDVTFKQYHLTDKICNKKLKTMCYLEPYNWLGFKGMLRNFKYKYLMLKYGKNISTLLPTGLLGVEQYRRIGFQNVFEWGYFTESAISDNFFKNCNSTPKLLFVGSLDKRKNILNLIKTMELPEFQAVELAIIGTGPLKEEVIKSTKEHKNINYLGTIPNSDILHTMGRYDILILPSIFDGWGAVVNEALSAGLRVICSDHCGAATLLKKTWRGDVFNLEKPGDMAIKISNQLKLGPQNFEGRMRIRNWYSANLSGEIAKNYFIEICRYSFFDSNYKPKVPWTKE